MIDRVTLGSPERAREFGDAMGLPLHRTRGEAI